MKIKDWEKELEEICSYGLKHLSLYQLTIEEGTVFASKNVKLPEDEEVTLVRPEPFKTETSYYEIYLYEIK